MAHQVVWSEQGLYRRFWGTVTASEYASVQGDAYGDPRFDTLRYIVVDFSEVTDFIATVADAEEILATTLGAYQFNPNVRVAVVTGHHKLAEVLNDLCDLSAYPLRLFQTLADARAWVNALGDFR